MTTSPLTSSRAEAPNPVILALDAVSLAGDRARYERAYYLLRPGEPSPARISADHPFAGMGGPVTVYLYPTRTYSEGMGGDLLSAISPEDRRFLRAVRRGRPDAVFCQVPLHATSLFEDWDGYFQSAEEKNRHARERAARASAPPRAEEARSSLVEINLGFIRRIKEIFASCMTKPNRQDFLYLAYKTFGLNLVVRLAFVTASVQKGDLPIARAVISTSWYQMQDAVFTVFGQTYMKFLGKMTGLLRIHRAYFGDLFFVYFQLCGFEFLNRLVLGPLGENPLVYTWSGIGLILFNIMQGMLSGGPLIPAINQLRKVGCISHNTMMHLYQLSSLTMQFGLFASFGYQRFYAILTTAILVLAWGSYAVAAIFFRDPQFQRPQDLGPVEEMARRCRQRTA
ncbi:MAG TPA: hypothetical protein DEB40_03205 [Elusimicrobia bacterium]|nr:hypothetical protein [Elusimicrobiota bacterium]HBT60739.1 hypothetical protein [Elusimicrobiota bacterium]